MATTRYFNNGISGDNYTSFNTVDANRLNNVPSFEHRLKFGERLDHLAFKNYGNGRLWWIIALKNNIKFEFTDVSVGDIIEIPYKPEDIYDLLQ